MPASYSVRSDHNGADGTVRSRTTTADLYDGDPFADVGQDNVGGRWSFTARQVAVAIDRSDLGTALGRFGTVRGWCKRNLPESLRWHLEEGS